MNSDISVAPHIASFYEHLEVDTNFLSESDSDITVDTPEYTKTISNRLLLIRRQNACKRLRLVRY